MSAHEPATSTRSLIGLAAFAAVCLIASLLGSTFTQPNLDWYATLTKPDFTPSNDVFPVAWTILFAMMAISGWLVWRAEAHEGDKRVALSWFGIQLVLNVFWSFAFFLMQNPAAGLGVILVLLAAIVLTIVFFARVSRLAALLLVPYVLWVAFAATLNFSIWILNSGLVAAP